MSENKLKQSANFYRVVLDCWTFGESMPYANDLSDVELSVFNSETAARVAVRKQLEKEVESLNSLVSMPKEKVAIVDPDGNVVRYEYPYTFTFAGEDSGYIRFWNGKDYQIVTTYHIFPVVCDANDLGRASYYKYRGFWILPNIARTSFKVEQFDTTLFTFRSLKAALRKIDDFLVAFQHGKTTN